MLLGQGLTVFVIKRDRLFDDLAELVEHRLLIGAVASAMDQPRSASDIALIFLRPFHNLRVSRTFLHDFDFSIARDSLRESDSPDGSHSEAFRVCPVAGSAAPVTASGACRDLCAKAPEPQAYLRKPGREGNSQCSRGSCGANLGGVHDARDDQCRAVTTGCRGRATPHCELRRAQLGDSVPTRQRPLPSGLAPVVKPLSGADGSTESAEPLHELIAGYELATFDVVDRREKLCFIFRRQLESVLVLR